MAWYNSMKQKRKKKKVIVVVGISVAIVIVVIAASVAAARRSSSSSSSPSSFAHNYDITWASDHARFSSHGEEVDLALDQKSGSGFGSINRFLFGNMGMQIRLVGNNSAGTIVAYYMSSLTDDRDEFDFQFFGNTSGQAYTLQTNVFVNGIGGREQRLSLWFDPTADFHSYSVVWNQYQVIFMVDSIPIRVFKNNTSRGVPYPYTKPMGIYTSIWAGGLRAGSPTVNWEYAPFVASYRSFSIDACKFSGDCYGTNSRWWSRLQWNDELQGNLTAVKRNYIIYDYCSDASRYATPPLEC